MRTRYSDRFVVPASDTIRFACGPVCDSSIRHAVRAYRADDAAVHDNPFSRGRRRGKPWGGGVGGGRAIWSGHGPRSSTDEKSTRNVLFAGVCARSLAAKTSEAIGNEIQRAAIISIGRRSRRPAALHRPWYILCAGARGRPLASYYTARLVRRLEGTTREEEGTQQQRPPRESYRPPFRTRTRGLRDHRARTHAHTHAHARTHTQRAYIVSPSLFMAVRGCGRHGNDARGAEAAAAPVRHTPSVRPFSVHVYIFSARRHKKNSGRAPSYIRHARARPNRPPPPPSPPTTTLKTGSSPGRPFDADAAAAATAAIPARAHTHAHAGRAYWSVCPRRSPVRRADTARAPLFSVPVSSWSIRRGGAENTTLTHAPVLAGVTVASRSTARRATRSFFHRRPQTVVPDEPKYFFFITTPCAFPLVSEHLFACPKHLDAVRQPWSTRNRFSNSTILSSFSNSKQ